MRHFLVALLFTLSLLVGKSLADDRISLRVLYCGDPGSEREADFKAFLEKYFTSVTVAEKPEFKEEQAKDSDVVIFDWTNVYKNGRMDDEKMSRLYKAIPILSKDYARPTILIGQRGGLIANPLQLKINWLCLCLEGPAHRVAVDHPLFHTPLEVKPEFEDIPTREGYPEISIDRSLGSTMKVWRAQAKDYPEIDPGLVSDLYGFGDSPDSEAIAQGISEKGPDNLALGRHANFFLWGFSAPPADMTPSGKRLFVNVVAYMPKFDGQKPLVHKETNDARSRDWALRYSILPRELKPEMIEKQEKQRRASLEKEFKEHPEQFSKTEQENPQAYIEQSVERQKKSTVKLMSELFSEQLRNEFGLDTDKYVAYYTENLEYLEPLRKDRSSIAAFVVDEDAKSLGTSNRKIASLEKWISMVETSDQPELATRLLKRYTQEEFDTAAKWRAWLTKNRDQLFFSDVGGFKFFVAPGK
jgi:hypothetical protein